MAAFAMLQGGCVLSRSDQEAGAAACAGADRAERFAIDPATGVCYEFASACDVPADWPPCGPGAPPPPACAADSECGGEMGCKDGACVMRGTTCTTDAECPLTQHCEPTGAAPGTSKCTDNAPCDTAAPCPAPMWCDLDPSAGPACMPGQPGCDGAPRGLCSRGERPATMECVSNADCAVGALCPAQYGGCSTNTPSGNMVCPSYCEAGCLGDGDCASGFTCNASAVCGQPNGSGGGDGVPFPCYGWCTAKMM
jgi:hypothetical protein